MTTHLCTFSDESMSRARDLCVRSAITKGGIGSNEIHSYNQWDIEQLRKEYPQLFVNGKGFGYWCWKPYLIDLLAGVSSFMRGVSGNDVIVYADAGIEFIAPVSHIIERMDQDIFLFGNNYEHAHWCKRDVVEEIWPERKSQILNRDSHRIVRVATESGYETRRDITERGLLWDRFGKQVQASVIFFRVSDYTRTFVKEWLDWCLFEGGRLIDDSPSRLPNHVEFRENRHDQAILTTMAYREGIKLHYWPAVYNLGYPLPRGGFTYERLPCYAADDYPSPLFHHHRRRNHEWQ